MQYRNRISRTAGQGCRETEYAVVVDDEIIAAVVLQNNRAWQRGTAQRTGDGSRDRIIIQGTTDGNAGNRGIVNFATAIGDGTSLAAWLGKYRDAITTTAGDGGIECKFPAGTNRKIIAAVILQHQAGTGQTGYAARDGVGIGYTVHLDVANSARYRATAVADGARLVTGLGEYGYAVGITTFNGGIECKRPVGTDRKIIAAVVLQHQAGAGQTGDRTAD